MSLFSLAQRPADWPSWLLESLHTLPLWELKQTYSSQSRSYVTANGQSASPSWYQASILDPWLDISYCLTFAEFVDVGRLLWREDESVAYNCQWSSQEKSLSSPWPVRLTTIFLYVRFETPPTCWARSPYYIPQGRCGAVISPSTEFPFRRLLWLSGLWWRHLNHLHTGYKLIAVAVNLRPTLSRPVCPGVRRPPGICDQFFFLLEISFSQLRVCNFVEPSLTRGQVCKLLYSCFWALPEQSLWGRNPAGLTAIFNCLTSFALRFSLYNLDANRIENTVSNRSCVVFMCGSNDGGWKSMKASRLTPPLLHRVRPAHRLKSMMFNFLNSMKSNISASTSTED
jgi:hypothetical protein